MIKILKTVPSSFICLVVFTTYCVLIANGQIVGRRIEFLVGRDHDVDDGVVITESKQIVPAVVRSTKKLCAHGSWTFYTEAYYGRFNADTVNSLTISGNGPRDCTTDDSGNMEWFLNTVKSIRLLGQSKLELFPYKYFITDKEGPETDLSKIKDLAEIKSFVLADKDEDYLACNSENFCVCLTADNGPFIAEDLDTFPRNYPLKDLQKFLVPVLMNDMKECLAAPKPKW